MTQRQRWTRILSGVVGFGAVMDTFGAVVASHAIERSLHASPWAMRWVLSAYLLPLALLLPLGTRVGDRFGHRRTLVIGLAAFAAAGAACAVAPSAGVLIAARVVAGMGAAAAFSGALGLADGAEGADSPENTEFPNGTVPPDSAVFRGDPTFGGARFGYGTDFRPSRQPVGATAVRVAAAADTSGAPGRRLGVTLGVVFGPALAGLADQGPGWRWYYGGQAVIAALLAVAARVWLGERRGRRHALDFEGCAVAAVAVVGLIWALNRSVEIGWGTVEVIGALALGCIAFGFLAVWNMPVGPLHRRRYVAANVTELLFAASIFGPAYPAVRDLQGSGGVGPLTTSLGLSAWAAVAAWPLALRQSTGRRILPRRFRPAGLFVHCAGLAWLASTVHGGAHPATEIAGLVLSAIGVGMALGADQSVPGFPVSPVAGVVSLVGAVAGIAVLAVTIPGFGAGTASSYHRELASVLRAATVLAAAASAASLAVPAASGATPAGPFSRLCWRLASLPARGISACCGGSPNSTAGDHPPGNCLNVPVSVG